MIRLCFQSLRVACTAWVFLTFSQLASAQGRAAGFFQLFGEIPSVTLAQLEEVEKALNLDAEQLKKVAALNDELRDSAADMFQNTGGDFDAMREESTKLFAEFGPKFNAILTEPQQKRAEEIYIQLNGGTALMNGPIAEKLKLTNEQQEQLKKSVVDHWEEAVGSFEDLRGMSDEERDKAILALIDSRNQGLLAVLTDEQKQAFDLLKGEKVDVDLANLQGPGG